MSNSTKTVSVVTPVTALPVHVVARRAMLAKAKGEATAQIAGANAQKDYGVSLNDKFKCAWFLGEHSRKAGVKAEKDAYDAMWERGIKSCDVSKIEALKSKYRVYTYRSIAYAARDYLAREGDNTLEAITEKQKVTAQKLADRLVSKKRGTPEAKDAKGRVKADIAPAVKALAGTKIERGNITEENYAKGLEHFELGLAAFLGAAFVTDLMKDV